jgi:uncharacterized protein YprB with RNaseH-like and TPR domain
MLTRTFCHIPHVGEKTECALWSAGLTSWCQAVQLPPTRLRRGVRESWDDYICESVRNFEDRNPSYFAEMLPPNQLWRLYWDFRDSCAFLDIETTGKYPSDDITTIALYDGRTPRHYVNGVNLDDFPAQVQEYRLLVTYNGSCFDLPFIKRHFGIRLPQAHIDLMHPLASLGLKGGLKECERKLSLARSGLEGIDGPVAVWLWDKYRAGDDTKALETLLAYNIQDAVVLHTLMVHTHNEKVKATPFSASHLLAPPSCPDLPFTADPETVARAKQAWEPLTSGAPGGPTQRRNPSVARTADPASAAPQALSAGRYRGPSER